MTHQMTGKQRLTAAIRGEPVDRVPIWLREGFPIGEPMPAPDDFALGWMHDPLYQALYRDIAPYADAIVDWGLGGWTNRFLMVPPSAIHTESTEMSANLRRVEGTVQTPRGDLTFVDEYRRGCDTAWHVKTLVKELDDLHKLAEVPWEFPPAEVEGALAQYQRVREQVGERGILHFGLSSPIVCISGCMKLETFLEFSHTQKPLFHELLREITRRNLVLIDALFQGRQLDTTANLGGSEQCTPPLMAPRSYDEYVVPYDGPIVARLHEVGVPVNNHCHGKIAHALQGMLEIGFDSTDPVEPPPAGNVTYAQARAIVGDKITLLGNLEFDELCFAEPDHIRHRVREILSLGPERLVLAASAGPISAVTPRLADNYRAWIETALTYS